MKYFSFLLLGFLLTFTSCGNDDDGGEVQLQADITIIEDYLAANSINAESTASGLHYNITTEGNGQSPSTRSNITIRYKGYLLNGDVFDSTSGNSTITFLLQNLIEGWKEGIPLMSTGGSATLYIPSKLGYGTQGSANIPPNTVIAFDIDLVDWQ